MKVLLFPVWHWAGLCVAISGLLSSCADTHSMNASSGAKGSDDGAVVTTQRPVRLMDGNMNAGLYGNTGPYLAQ